MVYLVTNKR